ncbi:hypothetical protein BJ166DRAFT_621076 [Pestalotiopsis sp. NC0098]|nr:hypothetical protein BJ166DRAFT_621076 [Pestalotiopsis sp. NC0098]
MSGLRTTSMTLQRLQPGSPPSAVRAYLIAILRERHGVSESEATRIAAGWSFGRGAELMSSDIETFRGLFGSEFGDILFTYTGEDLSQDEVMSRGVASQPRKNLFGVDPSFVLVESLFLVTVIFALIAYQQYDPIHSVAIREVLGTKYFISACGFVLLYALCYFNFF